MQELPQSEHVLQNVLFTCNAQNFQKFCVGSAPGEHTIRDVDSVLEQGVSK